MLPSEKMLTRYSPPSRNSPTCQLAVTGNSSPAYSTTLFIEYSNWRFS